MPYPVAFVRHTLLFSATGGEVATTSCSWAGTGGMGGLSDADADMLQAKALAFWTLAKSYFTPDIKFLGSRAAIVMEDGTINGTLERAITPVAGVAAGSMLPHEVAICMSLKSDTYGRSGRGRMYLPAPAGTALTTGGRLLPAAQTALCSAISTYLDANTAQDMYSVVASAADVQLYPVTSVLIGDVFDAQRRRRDALVEVYVVEPVDSTP